MMDREHTRKNRNSHLHTTSVLHYTRLNSHVGATHSGHTLLCVHTQHTHQHTHKTHALQRCLLSIRQHSTPPHSHPFMYMHIYKDRRRLSHTARASINIMLWWRLVLHVVSKLYSCMPAERHAYIACFHSDSGRHYHHQQQQQQLVV